MRYGFPYVQIQYGGKKQDFKDLKSKRKKKISDYRYPSTYRCVNPHFEGVATKDCPMYRSDQKVRFAKGMTNIFTSDMPKRVESAVRSGIIGLTNRTYYFEYRNGSRLIPPALQENIRKLFRDNGWTADVQFDGYVEDYDW